MAGVLGCINPDPAEQIFPTGISRVILVHDLNLPEVNGLETRIDVGGGLIIKPKLRFTAADIRERRIPAPITALSLGVRHAVKTEIPLLHRLAHVVEYP